MKKNTEKFKFYRNFGTLTEDSVVCDIYQKKFKKYKVTTKAGKCKTRIATDEEKEKYKIH